VVTVVVDVAELLAGLGSTVAELTVAVFEITVPLGVVEATFTTRVKTADSATATDAFVQDTVPVPPTAGVVHVHPAAAVRDTNVVPVGSVSLTTTLLEGSTPSFLPVIG